MQRAQRGIAAVEFALVFSLLLLMLYGIATFGAALYIQQAVSRAAEDGARAAPLLPSLMLKNSQAAAVEQIKGAVRDSLAGSLIVPAASNVSQAARRNWIASQVTVTVTVATASPLVTVTVSYPYSLNRVLPSVPLFDASRWMPNTLTSRATAVLYS
ncbi:TadE/TadG family type IV pilus assembly protein [Variovorax sp. RHLX14]|uniref:TadE/TadG family type IV pilus assembly protein n=1 Tax=Variovorax sp. RHLX14 TaxID=1259731 RepID=UPI003F48F53B